MFSADKTVPDADDNAPAVIGVKRKHSDCRSHAIHISPIILNYVVPQVFPLPSHITDCFMLLWHFLYVLSGLQMTKHLDLILDSSLEHLLEFIKTLYQF